MFLAERAYSLAQFLKLEGQDLGIEDGARKRIHSLKRLKKAVLHANDLLQSISNFTIQEKLQVEAYAKTLDAHLLFEKQQWNEALQGYLTAK